MEDVYASNDVDKQQKRHAMGMPFLFDTSVVRHAHRHTGVGGRPLKDERAIRQHPKAVPNGCG